MDYNALAQLLFPQVTDTRETLESRYPLRDVPTEPSSPGWPPSPTGFVHLGNLVQGLVSERMAHHPAASCSSGWRIPTPNGRFPELWKC